MTDLKENLWRGYMLQGVVVKAYSGFYYVEIANAVWECRLRGKFRLTKTSVIAGDRVIIKESPGHKGVIEEVLPRTSELTRPPVANVDQGVIVFACAEPEPHTELIDRMLIHAENSGLTPIICFNKTDLVDEEVLASLMTPYRQAGYTVLPTCTLKGDGVDEVRRHLQGRISVFAGPSGAGKSSLLNALRPGFRLKTGKVSDKIGRGRHTTRFAELLELEPGAFVVDTPGFSSLDMPEMNKQHLAELFPEFDPYLDECRFNGCLHRSEPDCAVKEAVAAGKLNQERYDHYLIFLAELTASERRY